MHKIRIYMFLYLFPPEYTGASIQALNLAKKLREKGANVTFVTGTMTLLDENKKIFDGFKVIRIWHPVNSEYMKYIVYWLSVFFILIRDYNKYDIIHCHGMANIFNTITSIFGHYFKKRTIVKTTLSNEVEKLKEFPRKGLEAKLIYYCIKKFDKIIAISNIIQKKLITARLEKHQIEYIPNGVDLDRFYPLTNKADKSLLRKKLSIPNGTIFSYIGVLDKRKKIDWMIINWIKVFKNQTNKYLIIAGPNARNKIMADGGGKEYAKLLNKISYNIGNNKIIFMPFIRNVEEYFQASDFFINPSESEGLSNAMLEAMACGVIPISSKTSGARDVIKHNINGYLFDIGDSVKLINIFDKINKNDELIKLMANNAQKTIKDHFSINTITEKYISLYYDLIEK